MTTQKTERELLVSVNEVRSLVIPQSTEDWGIKKAFEKFQHMKSLSLGDFDAFEDAMITLRDEFMKSRNPVLPSLTDIVISQLEELLSTIAQQGEALESARLEREEFDNVRKIVLRLPQYSFLSPQGGGVRRFRDQSGAWIERHEVVQAFHRHGFDTAVPDAALISQKVEG